MSTHEATTTTTTTRQWGDPRQCPFCEATLSNGGAGFVDHVEESPACRREFDQWRGNIRQDMTGGWGG